MRAVLQIIEVSIHVVFHFQNVVFVMVAPEGMVILRPICRACMKSAASSGRESSSREAMAQVTNGGQDYLEEETGACSSHALL
jgi:hypothetical protein